MSSSSSPADPERITPTLHDNPRINFMKWDVNARDKAASKFQEHEPLGLLGSFVSDALWASHPLNIVPGAITVTDVTDPHTGTVTQVTTTAADTVLPRPDFKAPTPPGGTPSTVMRGPSTTPSANATDPT